ncbi:hypothetical protein GGI25_001055 [Coemansia spiralis]|uniref:Peptidase S1 domain-containing protein n=2 Tax=Coemansia TaxID=4863 RepID=A0A9W8GCR1_9FUNG|nr:hypothetical protein EDC05_000725 [Coemansia umbellata]KAJ2625180.1 hypothetical protein GGI26_000983 [Coemansia sp. RSA 1358]KAJ2679866.1 hypothetical protein GGI25_001055 [Coemansia spiralis]
MPNKLRSRVFKRDVHEQVFLSSINDGVLVKEEQQTFCAVVPLNQQYALVAASCFETKSNKANDNVDYRIYLSGNGNETPTLMDVTSIQTHPKYNESSFANNLAIIQISNSASAPFTNYIGALPSEWATLTYVQHSLTEDMKSWNAPVSKPGEAGGSSSCEKASSLYKANKDAFVCSTAYRTSFENQNCKTPLKFAVGSSGGMNAIVALYSHSAISGTPGDGFCNSDNVILNYYTNLYNYIPWIQSETGLSISVRHASPADYSKPNKDFVMKNPSTSAKNDGSFIYSLFERDVAKLGSDTGAPVASDKTSTAKDSSGQNESCKYDSTLTITVTHTPDSCKCGE